MWIWLSTYNKKNSNFFAVSEYQKTDRVFFVFLYSLILLMWRSVNWTSNSNAKTAVSENHEVQRRNLWLFKHLQRLWPVMNCRPKEDWCIFWKNFFKQKAVGWDFDFKKCQCFWMDRVNFLFENEDFINSFKENWRVLKLGVDWKSWVCSKCPKVPVEVTVWTKLLCYIFAIL